MMVAEEFRWALNSGGRCGDDTIDTAAALSVGIGRFQSFKIQVLSGLMEMEQTRHACDIFSFLLETT